MYVITISYGEMFTAVIFKMLFFITTPIKCICYNSVLCLWWVETAVSYL
jgi:hypothetical protein